VTYQGANLGWDRMEGFMCVDPRLDKCGNYTGTSEAMHLDAWLVALCSLLLHGV